METINMSVNKEARKRRRLRISNKQKRRIGSRNKLARRLRNVTNKQRRRII